MLKSAKALLAATVVAGMVLATLLSIVAVAPPASAAPQRTVVVTEGKRSTVIGQLPEAYGGRLAVLEIVDGRRRQELGMAVADQSGAVRLSVAIGGAGTYKAHWRVIENGRTLWTSPRFALDVKRATAGRTTSRAAAVMTHAGPVAPTTARRLSGRTARLALGSGDEAGAVTKDATSTAAETATKTAGQTMKDFGTALTENIGWDFVADGVTSLYGVIFHSQAAATAQQVQQLTQDVQTGFATVEAQLVSIQSALNAVQQQLSTVQNEVVQTNASATASTCATMLSEANTYVTSIQDVFGNYQTVLDPQWISANLVGQSSQDGMNILGNTLYGAGAGQPSFGDGVTQLQTEVTALGRLLGSSAATAPTSLLGACSSAIAANIAAQYSAAQTSAGLSQSQAIVPAGAVDESYFTAMHSLVSYYTGWLALGQDLAARGGQMGLAVLGGSTITSAAQLNGLCAGVSPQQGSALACAGIAYNTQQSIAVFDGAWGLAGASWYDVTNGLLVADSKAGTSSGFLVPAKNLWVQDISTFGMAVPYATTAGSGSYTPSGPLSSLGAAPRSIPASAVIGLNFASPTWLGLEFEGANTAIWQTLIPTASQPTSVATQSAGALMAQAGLLNAGQAPTNLLLYTGEVTSFVAQNATNWFGAPELVNWDDWTFDISGSQSFPTPGAPQAAAFIDTNVQVKPGWNMVIQPPSGASGSQMTLGDVMNGADSGPMQYTPCIPSGGAGSTCGATESFVGTLTMPTNVTQNAGFYSPYQVTLTMDLQTKTNVGQSSFDVSLSNYNYTVNAFNSMMGYGASQAQYMWPVSPLNTAGQPGGSTCAMTAFTQGVNGNAGVTNVCANLYDDWMAGAVGVGSGPVSITAGGVQGTLTPAGNNVLQALVTNQSGQPQTVTVYATGTSGAQVGTVMTAGSGGASNIKCTSPTSTVLECSATVPAGTSTLDIPLLASSGTVDIALANGTSASSTSTKVVPIASGASALPGAVTGLSATASGQASNTVALEWTVPAASPPITGYLFTLTSPTGTVTGLSTSRTSTSSTSTSGTSTVSVTNGTTSGATATASIPLPSGQSGIWTVGVAAVNAGGVGPPAAVTAGLGTSTPAAPTGFQAVMNADGTVGLTWNPVSAIPVVSSYTIAITTPASGSVPSQTTTVVSGVPAYTVQSLSVTGQYLFSLTAVNSLGSSAPVTATVNVTGMVPTQPQAIAASIDADGWVNVAWMSSASVPTADSYFVALYGPGSTAATLPVASMQVSAPVKTSLVQVFGLYQLARDSKPGEWVVVVTPANSVGAGEFGMTQLVVTPAVIARSNKAQASVSALTAAPGLLLTRAQAACTAGRFSVGLTVFGTCTNGVFTPATGAVSPGR